MSIRIPRDGLTGMRPGPKKAVRDESSAGKFDGHGYLSDEEEAAQERRSREMWEKFADKRHGAYPE